MSTGAVAVIPAPTLLEFAEPLQTFYVGPAIPTFEDAPKLTHVFMTILNGMPCVNFEGTIAIEEWVERDFDLFGHATFSHPKMGLLHDGITRGVLGVLDDIDRYLAGIGYPQYAIAGHSKGAGETILAAGFMLERGHPPAFVRAFEPPRVGMSRLTGYLAGLDLVVTQTWNSVGADLVTEVPRVLGWEHPREPLRLWVPDEDDLATKHRLPAVIAALRTL